jgi:hypothetical protein
LEKGQKSKLLEIDSRICRACGEPCVDIATCKVHYAREHTFRRTKVIGYYEFYEFARAVDYLDFMNVVSGADDTIPEWDGPGWYSVEIFSRRFNDKITIYAKSRKKEELMAKLLVERDALTNIINKLSDL